jgi:pimeloyl-ACP methyl ester carboxylesterase
MTIPPRRLAVAIVLVAALTLWAQDFSPPPSKGPDAATLKYIMDKTKKLRGKIAELRKQGLRDPQLADLELFLTAAERIVQLDEFYQPKSAEWTLEALDRGLFRAAQVSQGESPWLSATGFAVARAFRSQVDGSLQPYAVTLPPDYFKDARKKWRLDVILHGRDPSLTEIKFLHQHNGDTAAPKGQEFVRLDVFGRGNTAYRWAGEIDVFEAVDAFQAVERFLNRDLIDRSRVVLRGFSMGGAGTWQIGLHFPDRFCALGPGAGFTVTHGYVKGLPGKLPPWQERCLTIYDAVDYAENVANVPVVAYAGADDPQLQAARNIEQRLKAAGGKFDFQLLIAPGLGHRFPPEWQAKAEAAYAPLVARGRPEYPAHVRFTTHTLRYNTCDWVEILFLDRHFERALVDARRTETGFAVKTANVRALHLTLAPGMPDTPTVAIDGQALSARARLAANGTSHLYLQRRGKEWVDVLAQRLLTEAAQHPRKAIRLQGPIDDAFMSSFVCVTGTKDPWHEATQKFAMLNLDRFKEEWKRHWRAELPVKTDEDVTDDDIANKNLILFGDPASNTLIAHVLDGLPLSWTKERIVFGDKKYSTAEHVPVLIYPSPLNSARYVVLNSGHTFHGEDYKGTNAQLYPRLGDYAVLRLADKGGPLAHEVATAGLFDDDWQIGTK